MHSQSSEFPVGFLESQNSAPFLQNYSHILPEVNYTALPISHKRKANREFRGGWLEKHSIPIFGKAPVSVFILPTELLIIIAQLSGEDDLYNLTCVNRRMANITCSIYVARRGLELDGVSVCAEGDAFRALSVWYRSREFTSKRLLSCRFSDIPEQAASQLAQLRTFLFLGCPRAHFETVQLLSLDAMSPCHLLSLLELIDRVSCQKVMIVSRRMSWWRDIEVHSLKSISDNYSMGNHQRHLPYHPVHLLALEHLDIDYRFFSATQWATFLSHLHMPSVDQLRIHGESSISVLKKFLIRHPAISSIEVQPRPSIFDRRTPPYRALQGRLQLPNLQQLHGSLQHVLSLLQSFTCPPPSLHQLDISSENLPYNVLIHNVQQCLALCHGPLRVSINYMIYHGFRVHSPGLVTRKLRSNIQLAPVVKLEITFNALNDELVLACCTPWLELCPGLTHVDACIYTASSPFSTPALRIAKALRNEAGDMELCFQ